MSRKAAIEAMCKACIYDPWGGGGTWRQQTEACTSGNCPLYPYRPLSEKRATEDEKQAMDDGELPTVTNIDGGQCVEPD